PSIHRESGPDPVRLRLLCGDQIYMDLSPTDGSPLVFDAPEPWSRYASQWRTLDFDAFLRSSPNLVMADDHEFWNDYPHGDAWLRWAETDRDGPLGKRMDRAFAVFQAPLNLDPADVADSAPTIDALLAGAARAFPLAVGPLTFFVLDTRTRRT